MSIASDPERETKKVPYVETDTASESESQFSHEEAHNPFANPKEAEYYMEIYEKAGYEARHAVDPALTWTKEEERRLIWRLDFHVLLWAFLMFVALDIDRSNISAVTGSKKFFKDVHITTNQYNKGQTYFYIAFLLAELPSQLIAKFVGVDRFIPLQLVVWSVCAICQCTMKSPGSFYALRVVIGLLQGGFIADTSLWMSYFYKNDEFIVRSGWFYLANPLTSVFAQLLAAAILTLDNKRGWSGWQYVFLIEGLITLVVGLMAFFLMPASAVETKAWFRPKGWFKDDRQMKIAVNRVLRDDPMKGGMNNRQGVGPKLLWKALSDYDLWPIYAFRLFLDSSGATISRYFSIIFSNLGFSVVTIDLLQVPSPALQCLTQLFEMYLVRRYQFGWIALWIPLWNIPFVAALRWWPGFLKDVWTTYVLIFLCLSGFTTPPISSAWCSHNAGALRTRAVSLAVVNMMGQLGSIVNTNLFRSDDAPRYKRGLEQIFALNVAGFVLVLLVRYYFKARNIAREKKWNKLTEDEKLEYVLTTKDEGNKRLDFRFKM